MDNLLDDVRELFGQLTDDEQAYAIEKLRKIQAIAFDHMAFNYSDPDDAEVVVAGLVGGLKGICTRILANKEKHIVIIES